MVTSSNPAHSGAPSPKFRLRLIDAATDEPFTEDQDETLATWVAGEHNQEYWIEVAVTEAHEAQRIMVVISVDDKSTGYNRRFTGNGTAKLGVRKGDAVYGKQTVSHALAFASLQASSSDGGEGRNQPSFGTVKVLFYDAVPGSRISGSLSHTQFESGCAVGPVASNKKKEGIGMPRSTLGATTKLGAPLSSHSWERRGLLHELTIRYSIRFGLVVRRIIREQERADDSNPNQVGPLRLARRRARELQSAGACDTPINLLDDEDDNVVVVKVSERPLKRQHKCVE
jgi:hypothetical protein